MVLGLSPFWRSIVRNVRGALHSTSIVFTPECPGAPEAREVAEMRPLVAFEDGKAKHRQAFQSVASRLTEHWCGRAKSNRHR